MTTEFSCAGIELQLKRWPLEQKNRSLQAWDAADELLIEQALTALKAKEKPSILVLNDSFGAVSCALGDLPHTSVGDSYISQQGCLANRALNNLQPEKLTWLSSLETWPDAPDLVLLKIPGQHSYLRFLLQKLSQCVTKQTLVIATGKAKDLHQNVLDIFRQEFGPVDASLQQKKCRYLTCHWHGQKQPISAPSRWALPDSTFNLTNFPAVFSRDQLDIGARFLLEQLPTVHKGQRIADLGCGNGVLGLQLIAQEPEAEYVFVDDSYQAVASAEASYLDNFKDGMTTVSFEVDDCLSQQANASFDLIVCNPPFHQQQAVTEHIAKQMFQDAKRCLKQGGRLRIVANRHLPYYASLKQLFGNCRTVASSPKFVILEVVKRS